MNPSRKPSFFSILRASGARAIDDDYRFDDDWFDDNECPNCNEPLSEHTQRERVRCALERIGGVPH